MASDAEKAFTQEQVDAAREEGVQKEKARVASLLPFMGADSERVVQAIENGEELNAELFKELNEKSVAKAREEALAEKAEREERDQDAGAEAREEDEAETVDGLEAEEKSEEMSDEEIQASLERVAAASKVKFNTNGGK